MKSVSIVVAGALLAIGLAGNAMAAPGQHSHGHGAKKVVMVKAASKKAAKKFVVKKVAQKKVMKKFAPKKVVKKIVKKSRAKTYKVRSGDTLSRIAARNHTSVKQLIKLNGLWGNKANNLYVGMKIRIA